jgi:hypothetical protein
LRQRGLHFVAKIDVHAGAGVSFLFHAAASKPSRYHRAKRNVGELWGEVER